MRSIPRLAGVVGFSFLIATVAYGGPDWVEPPGDAGSTPGSAEPVMGAGGLRSIAGQLTGTATTAAAPDYEDMYKIQIVDPVRFSAQTTNPGNATFNTELWLFDANGRGLLGNDDGAAGSLGSQLSPPANDATAKMIPGAGIYFLAISGFDNNPASVTGPIFNQATPFEVSGPDGPGGQDPIVAWTGTGSSEVGFYVIVLEGACFADGGCIPAASTWGLVILTLAVLTAAAIVLGFRHRRLPVVC